MSHHVSSEKRREVSDQRKFRLADKPANAFSRREGHCIWVLRVVLVCLSAEGGFYFPPGNVSAWWGAATGIVFALLVILLELRLRRSPLRHLVGGISGVFAGLVAACLAVLVLSYTSLSLAARSLLGVFILLFTVYIGIVVGASKGNLLNLQFLGGIVESDKDESRAFKVLDTSVLIDGRVSDIAEARFLDGTLLVPRFILRELQTVADSSDSLRRQRGRRGLDVLQRMQKMSHMDIRVVDQEFPAISEVDMKLIELARHYDAKIVTNDFNLNKVALVQGIDVLNVNQLANALKPVVLPGEVMRIFILREGREYNQGVGYLDDGTMVVVDGARKFVNRTIEITVTSLHQTTAGKMIFSRYDERGEPSARAAATTASSERASEAQDSSSDEQPNPLEPAEPRS